MTTLIVPLVRQCETRAIGKSIACQSLRVTGLRATVLEGQVAMAGRPDRAKVFQMGRRRADRLAAVVPGDRLTSR